MATIKCIITIKDDVINFVINGKLVAYLQQQKEFYYSDNSLFWGCLLDCKKSVGNVTPAKGIELIKEWIKSSLSEWGVPVIFSEGEKQQSIN